MQSIFPGKLFISSLILAFTTKLNVEANRLKALSRAGIQRLAQMGGGYERRQLLEKAPPEANQQALTSWKL